MSRNDIFLERWWSVYFVWVLGGKTWIKNVIKIVRAQNRIVVGNMFISRIRALGDTQQITDGQSFHETFFMNLRSLKTDISPKKVYITQIIRAVTLLSLFSLKLFILSVSKTSFFFYEVLLDQLFHNLLMFSFDMNWNLFESHRVYNKLLSAYKLFVCEYPLKRGVTFTV